MSWDVCAIGCEAGLLDETLKKLNADGWDIRQVYQEPPANYRVFAQRTRLKADSDGKEAEALAFLKSNPKLSVRKASAELKKLGIKRSATWVGDKKYEILGTGVKVVSGPSSGDNTP